MNQTPVISVVVPLYKEAKNIELLYASVKQVLEGLDVKYEVLFVGDGSEDATFSVSSAITARDSHNQSYKTKEKLWADSGICGWH